MKKLLSILVLFISICNFSYANEMIDVINTFKADKYALSNTYQVQESKEYYERFDQFYDRWKSKIKAIDFNQLSQDGKADYVLLKT